MKKIITILLVLNIGLLFVLGHVIAEFKNHAQINDATIQAAADARRVLVEIIQKDTELLQQQSNDLSDLKHTDLFLRRKRDVDFYYAGRTGAAKNLKDFSADFQILETNTFCLPKQ